MNVFVQLTSAGVNTGPFSLYSDVDGYVTPFQTNISRNKLLTGFTSLLVPDSTLIIRIQSEGNCAIFVDINVSLTTTSTSTSTTSTTSTSTTSSTTTTTTTEPAPPTYLYWMADVYSCNDGCISPIVSNLEIYTTGETITVTKYYSDVNFPEIIYWIWAGNGSGEVPVGTLLDVLVEYNDCTSAIADNCTRTTTTTTTIIPPSLQALLIARAVSGNTMGDASLLCGEDYNSELVILDSLQSLYFESISTIPTIGQILYIDALLTTPYSGIIGEWLGVIIDWEFLTHNKYDYIMEVSSIGAVLSLMVCAGITTTTTSTSSTTTTTTTVVPQYHVEMCVNDIIYDQPNEENIPYTLSPVLVYTPIKAGYNYLFFSIPIARTFIIKDSLGADVTNDFVIDTASGVSGVDIRVGYYDNYFYRSSSMFATSISINFTLTLS